MSDANHIIGLTIASNNLKASTGLKEQNFR